MFQMLIQGLITHYREGIDHTIVCYQVAGHEHQPRITANVNEVDQGSSSPPDSNDGDIACYNLAGKVKFTTGITMGVLPVSYLGAEIVPSLNSVSSGSVKNPSNNVKSSTTSNYLAAFFKIGEGYLQVFDFFEEMAVFPSATFPLNLPRPVPRTILYSAPASADVTIEDPNGKKIILQKTATVWFNNLPINPNQPMPHFSNMKYFFDQGTPVTVDDPVAWGMCPFGSVDVRPYCGSGSAAGIECSNTQWP